MQVLESIGITQDSFGAWFQHQERFDESETKTTDRISSNSSTSSGDRQQDATPISKYDAYEYEQLVDGYGYMSSRWIRTLTAQQHPPLPLDRDEAAVHAPSQHSNHVLSISAPGGDLGRDSGHFSVKQQQSESQGARQDSFGDFQWNRLIHFGAVVLAGGTAGSWYVYTQCPSYFKNLTTPRLRTPTPS